MSLSDYDFSAKPLQVYYGKTYTFKYAVAKICNDDCMLDEIRGH